MKYDLKNPCPNCPFRTDIPAYLNSGRVREIERGLDRGTFACHKTVKWDDEGEITVNDVNQHHCAGALILLEKLERPSQLMRIMERLGGYDAAALEMDAPVFDSFEEMRDAQSSVGRGGAGGRKRVVPKAEPTVNEGA